MPAFKATDLPKLLFGGLFNVGSSSVIPAEVIDSEANRLIAQTRRAGIQKEELSNGSPVKSGMTNKENDIYDKHISTQEVKNLLDGVPEAILVLSSANDIVVINKAAEELTGYKSTMISNKPIDKLIKLYRNDKEILDTDYTQRAYASTGLTLVTSKTISEKSSISINLISHKVENGGNFGIGSILTLYNLTQVRRLEEMKMNFVSVAAHELRTPITAIKGYLSVFMEENDIKLSQDQKSLLQQIDMNVVRLQTLVENLLNVSRIERGTIAVALEQVDLAELAKQAVEEFKSRALVKQISLSFVDPSTSLSKVRVDKVRILEVLSNLIGNAINYTESHGEVKVSMELKGKEIITHISDTGVGIPKEAIPHLFTKFYRVTEGLTQGQNSQGTGLGLFVSKSIIELHHGRIWVESELGKGSTFSFSLPV